MLLLIVLRLLPLITIALHLHHGLAAAEPDPARSTGGKARHGVHVDIRVHILIIQVHVDVQIGARERVAQCGHVAVNVAPPRWAIAAPFDIAVVAREALLFTI